MSRSSRFSPAFLAALTGTWAPLLLGLTPGGGAAQTATITEEIRTLQTYPFSEPNPIPILTEDPRLYPYHSFEGYSSASEPREWRVVKLENDYIEVYVLPEVGGKVWGAVVKETGHEFIYRNEVMKFRNIALRGPWTSGGIEFNFGVIGHTPSTATPVDYALKHNSDGSVSCWVGGMDLPSRTHWRIEIRLPADRAYFETNVLWSNPTPLEQPYYNWMTAAAFARDDLEMSMPGNAYLEHSGKVRPWPEDGAGRYLPLYANNTFGGHKSYHVVGELNDFFGGYYHDEDYGFGHWARYEDMPGQKLWLWALSREGGVWEDLLTDTDGQYVEFQAGRLFVQYSPGSEVNPITQAGFDPISASRWTETWFPLEGIGGLTDASREGALYASEEGGNLTVGVNAFREIQDTLKVWSAGELASAALVDLQPLKPLQAIFDVLPDQPYRIQLQGLGLDYESDPEERTLSRPFETDPGAFPGLPEVDRDVFQARELMKGRRYAEARELLQGVLEEEPWNREALLSLAELSFRRGLYGPGLEQVNRALQLDAYDAEANFLAGTLYRALGRTADARDAWGWAARSMAYRSAAYTQLAELLLGEEDFGEAKRYALLALEFDARSLPAFQALALIARRARKPAEAESVLRQLLMLDPLNHFAMAERHLTVESPFYPTPEGFGAMLTSLGGEYPDQTLLELVVRYQSLGLRNDALTLLSLAESGGLGGGLLHRAWEAWLADDPTRLPESGDPAFVFPFRPESLPVLEWATEKSNDWVWTYLLGLNLWAADRPEEAAARFEALDQRPDFGPFYVARGLLLQDLRNADPEPDLRRAVALAPENRTVRIHLIRHLQDEGGWEEALKASSSARQDLPDDFNLDLLHAKALINLGRGQEAADILNFSQVLPSENARESHRLYEQGHTLAALDGIEAGNLEAAREHLLAALEWPESLGQGRPYVPEERLVRFILGRVEERLGNAARARAAFDAVLEAAGELDPPLRSLDLLALQLLEESGRAAEAEELNRTFRLEIQALTGNLENDLEGRMILRALTLRGSQR